MCICLEEPCFLPVIAESGFSPLAIFRVLLQPPNLSDWFSRRMWIFLDRWGIRFSHRNCTWWDAWWGVDMITSSHTEHVIHLQSFLWTKAARGGWEQLVLGWGWGACPEESSRRKVWWRGMKRTFYYICLMESYAVHLADEEMGPEILEERFG